MLHWRFLAVICTLCVLVHAAPWNVLSFVDELEEIMTTQQLLLKELENYIDITQKHLELVKRFVNEEKYLTSFEETSHKITRNPIHVYQLLKTTHLQWRNLDKLLGGKKVREAWLNMMWNTHDFPTWKDLRGAATSLMMLQDTYSLNVTQFAQGDIQIPGRNMYTSMFSLDAVDCMFIAKQAFRQKLYDNAIQWLEVALLKTEEDHNSTRISAEVQRFLAKTKAVRDETQKAEKRNETRETKMAGTEQQVQQLNINTTKIEERKERKRTNRSTTFPMPKLFQSASDEALLEIYRRLCRGETMRPVKLDATLKCFNFDNGHPYLFLKPFKVEEKSLNPYICITYDFAFKEEMKIMKDLALEDMRPSIAQQDDGKFGEIEDRVSKQSWIGDERHMMVKRISQRISWLTGLDTGPNTGERYQVVRYGVGGFYVPHEDFIEENAPSALGTRLATLMIYLEDVDAGGATVFPQIGVTVQPKKGSAVLWWNLKRSGKGDYSTLHGGCPVLHGVKWISTKWVQYNPQIFRYPCVLNQREKFFLNH